MSIWWLALYGFSLFVPGLPLSIIWLDWRDRRGYTGHSSDDIFGLGLAMNCLWPIIPVVAWTEYLVREKIPTEQIGEAVQRTLTRLFP